MKGFMTAPFSMDLRERVAKTFEEEPSSSRIAERFGVSPSFVRKLRIRLRKGGTLVPLPHGGGRTRCLDADDLAAITKGVATRCGSRRSARAIGAWLSATWLTDSSSSTKPASTSR